MSFNSDYLSQLQAWIWEAGVKLGYPAISLRIEKELGNDEALACHFKGGRSSKLLFIARTLQLIIADIESNEKISIPALKKVLNLDIELLSDKNFYNEADYIKSLICLYHSTLVQIFSIKGKVKADKLTLSSSSDSSKWKYIKTHLGFKDDKYKEDFVKVGELFNDFKELISQKKLGEKQILKSTKSLRDRLKNLYSELINLLPPPALLNICHKENREELKRLNFPSYNLLMNGIQKEQITEECLFSIIDSLPVITPQAPCSSTDPLQEAEMRRKSPRIASPEKFKLVISDPLEEEEEVECTNVKDVHCQNKIADKLDMVIVNGVIYMLQNTETLGEKDPVVTSEEVVSFTRTGSDQRNCELVLKTKMGKVVVQGSNGVDKLSDDIENLRLLTGNLRKLLEQLELKTAKLKDKREKLLKAGEDKTMTNGELHCHTLNNNSLQEVNYASNSAEIISNLETNIEINKANNSDSTEQISKNLETDKEVLKYNHFGSIEFLSSDLEPRKELERSKSIELFSPYSEPSSRDNSLPKALSLTGSMPALSPEMGSRRSQKVNSSGVSMPKLTPHSVSSNSANLSRQSPTPSKKPQSSEDTDYDPKSKIRRRKRRKKSPCLSTSKRRRDSSSNDEEMVGSEAKRCNLSRIDLVVTNAHSTSANNAIILESIENPRNLCQEAKTKSPEKGSSLKNEKALRHEKELDICISESLQDFDLGSKSTKKSTRKNVPGKRTFRKKRTMLVERQVFSDTSSEHVTSSSDYVPDDEILATGTSSIDVSNGIGRGNNAANSSSTTAFYTPNSSPNRRGENGSSGSPCTSEVTVLFASSPIDGARIRSKGKLKNCSVNLCLNKVFSDSDMDVYS